MRITIAIDQGIPIPRRNKYELVKKLEEARFKLLELANREPDFHLSETLRGEFYSVPGRVAWLEKYRSDVLLESLEHMLKDMNTSIRIQENRLAELEG